MILTFVSVTISFSDTTVANNMEQGGYCMTMLYGVFPPAMAWAVLSKNGGGSDHIAGPRFRPTLICVGILAGAILIEQIFQDLSILQS